MIVRVTLENFMSHRKTVIEPAPGLTVLVGPNNCGKSALVAGLEAVCRNNALSYAVRHGEKSCRVTVETDDGHTVTWERRAKGGSTYIIDGERIDRIGRGSGGVPDRVHELLKLPFAADGSDTFELHFGNQKDPIFLLGDRASGRRAAQFLGLSSDAGKLLEMQRLHGTLTSQRQREKKRLEAEADTWSRRVEVLEPVNDTDEELALLEQEYDRLNQLAEDIRCLEELLPELRATSNEVEEASAREGVLRRLPVPCCQHDLAALDALLEGLRAHSSQKAWSERAVAALSDLAVPPMLHDMDQARAIFEELGQHCLEADRLAARADPLVSLTEPPQQEDFDAVRGVIDSLVRGKYALAHLRAAHSGLDLLAVPPALADPGPLRELMLRMADARSSVEAQRGVRVELASLQAPPALTQVGDIAALLADLKVREHRHSCARRVSDSLAGLEVPPAQADPTGLQSALAGLGEALSETDGRREEVAQASADAVAARELVESWVRDNPTCPACGSQMDVEHVVGDLGGEHV